MTRDESVRVKSVIVSLLAPKLAGDAPELQDDVDLRAAGLIDSLGFMQLISDLESRLGYQVNIADLNPADLTKLGPLCRHIAWRRSQP
jgi:acyl carrier protein